MKNSKTEFIPLFRKALLLPRYWLTRLELCIIGVFAAIPPSLRDPVLEKWGYWQDVSENVPVKEHG
ncbi:lipid A biosynthesis (KDO)2-(lauroyl)-lipid IVA acyltransferase [Escherichia coli]|nr:lipid A biosynthesis (KDO)2-(lauroyl)-lipid IVA acyltransferase [Escherichia coli]